MAKEFVAYTELGGFKPGDVVNPADWSAEDWRYMVEHGVVVPKNSPDDPKVLEENREETGEDDDGRTPEQRRLDAAMEAHEEASKPSTEELKTTEPAKSTETAKQESKPAETTKTATSTQQKPAQTSK